MTTANKITSMDFVARAKSLLLSQFKDKENINKVVEALVEQIQEIDDAAIDLQQVRMLDNAYGIYLDNIGDKLKVPRTTLDDEDYRTAIKVRMLKNNSKGSYKEIDNIIKLMTYDQPRYINTTHPYVVELSAFLACLNTEDGLELIKSLFPVNITVRVMNSTATPFGFAGNPQAKGFGSATDVGGQLVSLVKSFNGITDDPRFISRETPITSPSQGSGNIVVPPAAPQLPLLVNPPSVTPSTNVYESTQLSCTDGTWTSPTPLSYLYQWFRDGESILGETNNFYNTVSGDESKVISCRVSATNAEGAVSVYSNEVTILGESPSQQTGIIQGLGLFPNYYNSTNTNSCTLQFTFDTTGRVTTSGTNRSDVIADFLSPSGSATGYEVSYTNSVGDGFTTPQENVWYPLTSNVIFRMTVSRAERDKGGTQVFTIREIATGLSVSRTINVAVSAEASSIL